MLTIAIPTYNRPDKVLATVKSLLPQLTHQVNIMVVDNHSDINIQNYFEEHIGLELLDQVTVIRNRINIGMDGNICRCVELCETPYVWTLSDDDKIADNAVQIILAEIEEYKDYDLIGFNFNSNCNQVGRENTIIINNTKELAENFDFFGNWLFVSTGVYKVSEFIKHFRYSFWGSYSMAAFMPPVMVAISQNKTFVLSEKYIVTNIPLEDRSQKWSDFQITLSICSLLEARIGFKQKEYRRFGQKFRQQFVWFADVLYSILKSVDYNIDLIDEYHIYLYRQIYYRTFEFREKKGHQLWQYHMGLQLLKNKPLLKFFWKTVPRIKRKSADALPFYLFRR